MEKKSRLLWILASVLFLACIMPTVVAATPGQTILALYAADIKERSTVDPYIISVLALNEVEHGRHYDEVRQFLLWYFAHLNYPDKHGLTGTIYVYSVIGGEEYATGRYDSVDGYAGLFLHLLRQYVLASGDREILANHWGKIEDIAYLIPYLQERDGSTRALTDRPARYLMDNCEAYGGMVAYLELRRIAGKGESAYYAQVRNSLRQVILTRFYDPRGRRFFWALEGERQSRADWNRFYPDALAQIFPIYYGLLEDRPELQQELWRTYKRRYAAGLWQAPVEQRIISELTQKKLAKGGVP